MGANIVSTFIEGFTTGGAGLATGLTGFFDGLVKGAEGGLTTVAEIGITLAGVGLVIGIGTGLFRKLSAKLGR